LRGTINVAYVEYYPFLRSAGIYTPEWGSSQGPPGLEKSLQTPVAQALKDFYRGDQDFALLLNKRCYTKPFSSREGNGMASEVSSERLGADRQQ